MSGTQSTAVLWLPSTLIDIIFPQLPSVVPCALWRKGTYSWHFALTKSWGFQLFLANSFPVESERKKENISWHLKYKFCPNSALFAQIILLWRISPLLKVPKEPVSVQITEEVINALLALSQYWMLAHPTWVNQEQRTTYIKPLDILLEKTSPQKITTFRWRMRGKNKS